MILIYKTVTEKLCFSHCVRTFLLFLLIPNGNWSTCLHQKVKCFQHHKTFEKYVLLKNEFLKLLNFSAFSGWSRYSNRRQEASRQQTGLGRASEPQPSSQQSHQQNDRILPSNFLFSLFSIDLKFGAPFWNAKLPFPKHTKLRQLSLLIIQCNWLLKWARNEGIIWSFHWELPICPSYTFLGNYLHCDMSGDAHKEYVAICPGPSHSVLWCYHSLMTSVLVLLPCPLSSWLLSSLPDYHGSPFSLVVYMLPFLGLVHTHTATGEHRPYLRL